MIFNLIQTNKDLFASQFEVKRGAEQIGAVSLQGKLGSMEAVICGTFCGVKFEMGFGRSNYIEAGAFRPYLLKQNGIEAGTVYQTKYNGGLFKKYEFHQMVRNGLTYDLFPIGFGNDGSKCPIYHGKKQVAQIEKDCMVYNDLHDYHVFAIDENEALTALFFCLYMYVNVCYKPGQKVLSSTSKTVSITTNKLLKEKFDPYFRDSVTE